MSDYSGGAGIATNPEAAVLGIAMFHPSEIDDCDGLYPEDFADARLGALWSLVISHRAAGEPVSLPSVAAGAVGSIPGVDHGMIHDLAHHAPPGGSLAYHARLVADAATRRRLAAAGQRIVQLAESSMDTGALVEVARAEVDATSLATATLSMVSDRIAQTITDMDAPARHVPTPWPSLNAMMGGWQPGSLYVIGARPGVGKSIAALEAALGLARFGVVALSSLEMPEAELHNRIIANLARVRVNRLDRRELTEQDRSRIAAARPRFDLPISIDDRPAVTTTEVRSHARTAARQGHLAGVIVDYLQLMVPPRGDRRPRHEVVAGFSRDLKILAKELDVPVIALSQLNRNSADGRPRMSDLRESGGVEQDADVILLLQDDEDEETRLTVHVEKNRRGTRGSIELVRRGWHSSLVEHDWGQHAA